MVLKKTQKKKPKRGGNDDEDDKISSLPDALIHHIYSFLPTKCVLSTCILSKRWNHLSNSAPILDFDEWRTNFGENIALAAQKFMNFLDTVLFVHEKPKIQKFVLTVSDSFDETRVNRWFRTVIKRKVEELVLSMTPKEPFIFPLSFFTCVSLVVLDLEYTHILNLPNTISFPRIKILRLAYITFVNENLTGELFSNCPILEELSLFQCDFEDFKVLCIMSPTLKCLSIRKCRLFHQTLKVFAPNLLTIKYAAEMPADFVLDSFQSLVEADIEILNNQDQARIYAPLIKLYQKLSNVKLLKTSGSSFWGLAAANILIADLPTFCNLVRLEVSSAFWSTWDPHASFVSSMKLFLWFLQLSPNIESIDFTKGVQNDDLEDYDWTVNSLPQYSLPNLKVVVIRDFMGHKVELDMVKFFLANAGVLQTMTIRVSKCLSKDYKKQTQIASELLKFPRYSSRCALEFFTAE
ncbi:hypothetical protein MKX03_022170 [Papaver bracteatum]|nr:hypothetical protein MKX03_022170 [Papaver bracteatum]